MLTRVVYPEDSMHIRLSCILCKCELLLHYFAGFAYTCVPAHPLLNNSLWLQVNRKQMRSPALTNCDCFMFVYFLETIICTRVINGVIESWSIWWRCEYFNTTAFEVGADFGVYEHHCLANRIVQVLQWCERTKLSHNV